MTRLHDQIEILAVAGLVPYARNSRTNSDEQIAQLAASIAEFGFTNPVLVDEAGGIIAGHGRVLAARKLGLDRVPCLRLTGLTEAQRRAYVIADNRLALNAGWDPEKLRQELQHLVDTGYDASLTGFSLAEIDASLEQDSGAKTPDAIRALEAQTDAAPADDAAYRREMADTSGKGLLPIVPMYAEHHQAFVIVCDNSIDEAWLRNLLKLNGPRQSYKDQKFLQANVLTAQQFREALGA